MPCKLFRAAVNPGPSQFVFLGGLQFVLTEERQLFKVACSFAQSLCDCTPYISDPAYNEYSDTFHYYTIVFASPCKLRSAPGSDCAIYIDW